MPYDEFDYPPDFGYDYDYALDDIVPFYDEENDADLGVSDDNWACGTLQVEDECW